MEPPVNRRLGFEVTPKQSYHENHMSYWHETNDIGREFHKLSLYAKKIILKFVQFCQNTSHFGY